MTLFKAFVLNVFFIIILILGMWFLIGYLRFSYRPIWNENEIQQATTIEFDSGSNLHDLANILYQRGLFEHPNFFIFWVQLKGEASLLKAGEYQITRGMTARELLHNILAGKVKQRSITFIEGWTFRQIKGALDANPHIKHMMQSITDAQIISQLDHAYSLPEGLFFPDTYFFTWGDSDIKILQEAYQHMQFILNEAWKHRAQDLPYKNPYQALIVASLVEKETAIPRERNQIAGVILRRLKKRMPLQIDPTVLYGLGRLFDSPITKDDLHSNTVYNTYRHYGLPPTPISMPSRASIVAALNPAPGNALYYVACGNKAHVFSATYSEHRRAVRRCREKKSLLLPFWLRPYLNFMTTGGRHGSD